MSEEVEKEEISEEEIEAKPIDFFLYEYEGKSFGLINVTLQNGSELDISLSKADCITLCEKMRLVLALNDIQMQNANNQQKN